MIVIADSGSTKTTWNLVDPSTGLSRTVNTAGMNPIYQDSESMYALLKADFREPARPSAIFFYGAGCIGNHVNNTVRVALERYFNCDKITIGTDLLAAAHSLCRDQPGIACILGTGSNSCFYDGLKIVKNVSPLGFILGDEGSGAVIGRKLVSDVLKNQLPEAVREKFYAAYGLKSGDIIEQVYKKPYPSRFLAGFTRFIHENREEDSLMAIVKNSFTEFFKRNIMQYAEARSLPVHFTGSVAFYFSDVLKEVAAAEGYQTGKITQSPSGDLVQYHLQHIHDVS